MELCAARGGWASFHPAKQSRPVTQKPLLRFTYGGLWLYISVGIVTPPV
ncbi:MAG: hypothetical protein JWO38_912 [Gemmataceae bacterium]|nr:hypothetical protein [Gemmataceae bacterium]